eukprot:16155368-Heterocapsa_arctica.AAC.1
MTTSSSNRSRPSRAPCAEVVAAPSSVRSMPIAKTCKGPRCRCAVQGIDAESVDRRPRVDAITAHV